MRKKSLSTLFIFTCELVEYCYKQLQDFLSNSKFVPLNRNPTAVLKP